MCFKIQDGNELGTVKLLMTMSFNSVVEDVFGIDQDDIELDMHLVRDLHMNSKKQLEFSNAIADMFDGVSVDFSSVKTLDDVFDIVVEQEFSHIPEEAFSM
ncbi:MAG: phosphopantetheine-binding protein [Gammaproteobacteria bacterium]|nr:phosphopantetheine-binding protein [Gammaproteobacteria bacterium]